METNNYYEKDILYNLVTFLNTSSSEEMFYTICYNILSHIDEIPTINILDLAKMCYTSPATISRFCRHLKFANFAEFKNEVCEALNMARNEIKLSGSSLVEAYQNPQSCVDLIYDTSIKSLQMAKEGLKIEDVDQFCKIIHEAKKIHFFGFQFNKIIASDFQIKLLKLGKLAYAFADRGDDAQRIELLDEDSLAIVLSSRARDLQMFSLVDAIKTRNSKVVLVTMNKDAKVIEKVDHAFVVNGIINEIFESSTSETTVIKTFLDLVYFRYGILYPRKG